MIRPPAIEPFATGAMCLAIAASAGCKGYRIEYIKRPAYYRDALPGGGEDRVTLEDGTVLVFTTRDTAQDLAPKSAGDKGEPFRIRQEKEDGTVVLRALLPQHVLANALTCLRNQEYQLMWDQLVAARTHREYELREQGYEEFARFSAANRQELAATLTRMLLGLSRGESMMENVGGGVVRFYFHPRIGSAFKFKTAEVIAEGGGLRLLMIR
jgi:hypothetical protein